MFHGIRGEKIADRVIVTSVHSGDYVKVQGANFLKLIQSISNWLLLTEAKLKFILIRAIVHLLGVVNVTTSGKGDAFKTVHTSIKKAIGVHDSIQREIKIIHSIN